MKTEREMFEEWIKKEHTHIFNGAERGDNRFKMDIDFMYMAWQASASREGYKLVPLEPTEEMLIAADNCVIDGKVTSHNIYKAMIEVSE